jgi:hypothetical protein
MRSHCSPLGRVEHSRDRKVIDVESNLHFGTEGPTIDSVIHQPEARQRTYTVSYHPAFTTNFPLRSRDAFTTETTQPGTHTVQLLER